MYAASLHWDRPFTCGIWLVLSNVLLINDLVGQSSIDLVNWTLCVELVYLMIALLAPQVRAGSTATMLGAGAALCAASALLGNGWLGGAPTDPLSHAYTLSAETLFLVFMLIGVLFASLYALRRRVCANPASDLIAAVSFPFHLIHSPLGYSIPKLLIVSASVSYPAALAVTLALLLLVAWSLHVTVEQATVRVGRRLAAWRPRFAENHEYVITQASIKA